MPRPTLLRRLLLLSLATCTAIATACAEEPWRDLFNGKDLTGWKANAFPESWSAVDGVLRTKATKESSHLFYVGPTGTTAANFERFKDFELEVIARSEPNSNSGIFIHTDTSTSNAKQHLAKGYEIQLNSSAKEKRKTGSLYAIIDLDTSAVDESQWFKVLVTVRGKTITVRINDQPVIDYTEPDNVVRPPERAGRKLNPLGGAIALQGHDPASTFYFKTIRLRPLSP